MQSRVKSTPEPACPVDPRVDELLVDIGDTLDRCDGLRIADLIQQPSMRFIVWYKDQRRERYLDGCDRALAVRGAHLRANKILGFDRIRQRRHAPCPQCSLPTLGNWIGDSTITCSDEGCGAAITLTDYEIYCCELAEKK